MIEYKAALILMESHHLKVYLPDFEPITKV